MKKYTPLALVAFLFLSTFLSGCAIIFSSSKQKVSVKSATPDAVIRFDGDSVGKGTARLKLDKYRVYNIVTAEKEGYKSRNYCITLDKYAPAIALAPLDAFGVIFISAKAWRAANTDNTEVGPEFLALPGLVLSSVIVNDLKHAKTHRYEKHPVIPKLEPYETRKSDEKFLLVDSTNVDIKAGDQQTVYYKRLKKYEDKVVAKSSTKSYADKDVTVNNTIFDRTLNNTLHKMHFIDTVSKVFPNFGNTIYLNATIRKITFHEIGSPYRNGGGGRNDKHRPDHLFAIELSIDWNVMDFYRQRIATLRTVERSDLFTLPYGSRKNETSSTVFKALRDNMELSVMNVRRQLNTKGLLKVSTVKEENETLEIQRPQTSARKKDDFGRSCVAVACGDKEGSGAIISEDGYIITSFHLVAAKDSIRMTFNDSSTAIATLVRKNESCDMALLKVQKTGLLPFVLSNEAEPEIGMDIWAVGLNLEVGDGIRLSRGIISGIRKTNGLTMLQTDVSLNAGNSGSPLVNEQGVVTGIVSFKIARLGVEGIGFALSAHDVLEKLALKYK